MKKDTAITTTNKEVTLQQMVENETENRKVLTQFITNHMKDGTDFGTIMIGGRASKPSLFKSGAEKFASLMNLRADVIKDADTWEMAGNKPGLFCYRCNLYNKKNELVGMGLGACSIEEKKSANNAIKIAKKRAFVDAILTTGALSDFFTQDMEDVAHEEKPMAPRQMREAIEAKQEVKEENGYTYEPNNGQSLVTPPQIKFIERLLKQKGYTEQDLLNKHELTSMSELTKVAAGKIIKTLLDPKTHSKKKPLAQQENKIIAKTYSGSGHVTTYEKDEEEINLDEVDKGIEEQISAWSN